MFGTMDVLGLPRIQIPAEFLAAGISMFVQPSNLMVACRWMEQNSQTAEAQGNPQGTVNRESIAAEQLFSLCLQLVNDEQVAVCRAQFETRTNQAITKAESLLGGNKNAQTTTGKTLKGIK